MEEILLSNIFIKNDIIVECDGIIRAVDRYKEETKDTEIQFIKMSIGFFNEDYIGRLLDDDYQSPKAKELDVPVKKYKVLR